MSRRQVFAALGGVLLGMLLAALDQTVVSTALPRIVADLHGLNHLSWVVTAYLLTSTVTVPLYGKLSDLYGRRRLFIFAISVFLLGSALCGAAQTMTQLILFRGLQGFGAGGLVPLALVVIGDLFSPRERGRYQAFTGAVWALAAVAGPVVGGFLTEAISWRWIFYINLPLGALALAVVATTMHLPTRRSEHRIDYSGAFLLAAAVACLLLVAVWGGATYPWRSAEIGGLAAAGLAFSVAVVLVEAHVAEPVLPLALFRNPVFLVSTSASLLVGAASLVALVYVPLFVQGVLGSSPARSGLILTPLLFAWVLASVGAGRLISRWGRYRMFPIAGTAVALIGFGLLTRMSSRTGTLTVVGDMVVIGCGMGPTFQTYVLAAQNAVPRSELGVATATFQFFRSIGGAFAIAGSGALLVHRLAIELQKHLGNAARTVDPAQVLRSSAVAERLSSHAAASVRVSLAASLHSVFLASLPLMGLALVAALLLKELPLRRTAYIHNELPPSQPFPSPDVLTE